MLLSRVVRKSLEGVKLSPVAQNFSNFLNFWAFLVPRASFGPVGPVLDLKGSNFDSPGVKIGQFSKF